MSQLLLVWAVLGFAGVLAMLRHAVHDFRIIVREQIGDPPDGFAAWRRRYRLRVVGGWAWALLFALVGGPLTLAWSFFREKSADS